MRYQLPKCQGEIQEYGQRPDGTRGEVWNRCNTPMQALGERHPSFGPNYRPGAWVFRCPRCGAIRAIDDTKTGRYAEMA